MPIEMRDMKEVRGEQPKEVSKPYYPSVSLSTKQVPEAEEVDFDDDVTLHIHGKVDSISQHDKDRRSIGIVIQRLAIKQGHNPAVSKKQQMFMGAELARRRAGKKTRTKMTTEQIREFAATRRKGLPMRKSNPRHQSIAKARLDNSRRYGKPRTDEERRARHKSRYGTSRLPKRGARLRGEV